MKIIFLENGRIYTWNQFKMLRGTEVIGTEEEGGMLHHPDCNITEVIELDEKMSTIVKGVIVSTKLEETECDEDANVDWNKHLA